jgi:hypothetical protein
MSPDEKYHLDWVKKIKNIIFNVFKNIKCNKNKIIIGPISPVVQMILKKK